ncbi:MAG: hypothetical protein J0L81_06380 [Caulobacterales bacterium]|nr:hypothetical protein [Caulobacterales bacterium]
MDASVGAFSGRIAAACDEAAARRDEFQTKTPPRRDLGGVRIFRQEEAYFFLPAGFFAAVFLPAAFVAVFFFAAMCTSPDIGMNKSLLRFLNL